MTSRELAGRLPGQQLRGQSTDNGRADFAATQPDLDEVVEDGLVASGGANSGVYDGRHAYQPGGDGGVLEMATQQRADRAAVTRTGGTTAALDETVDETAAAPEEAPAEEEPAN